MSVVKKIPYFIILFFCSVCFSQNNRISFANGIDSNLQFGASIKGVIEFQYGIPNAKIGINLGAGKIVLNDLYTSLNLELDIYYGGLASQYMRIDENRIKKQINADFIIATTVTGGWDKVFGNQPIDKILYRNSPLYYFSDFAQPALQNPFGSSVSFGSNWIFPFDSNKAPQRIGFIDLHFEKFQIAYSNDGGPFMGWFMGDGEDRYYTGSGFATYNDPSYKQINTYTLSFHKYTGWTKDSFDDADLLLFGFTDYKKTNQAFYNSAFWSINVGDVNRGSVFFRFNNPKNFRETQNMIHYFHGNPFHQNLIPPYHSFGFSTSYSSTLITQP